MLNHTNTWLSEIDSAYVHKDFGQIWCLVKEFSQTLLRENYLPQLEDFRIKKDFFLINGFIQSSLYQILIVYLQRIAPIAPFLAEHVYLKLIDQINPIESSQSSIFLLDWLPQIYQD